MMDVIRKHIEIVEGGDGPKAVIAGNRIRVHDIVIWNQRQGMSPEEIVCRFPELTLSDIHAALAYYWDNQDEIEQSIAEEYALDAELRKRPPSRFEDKLMHHRVR